MNVNELIDRLSELNRGSVPIRIRAEDGYLYNIGQIGPDLMGHICITIDVAEYAEENSEGGGGIPPDYWETAE